MQPINYSIDVGNPFASAMQGYQIGEVAQQRQLQQQQQQAGLEQQKLMQTDLAALSQKDNPSATDFARMTIKYPQLAEHFKNTWTPLNAEQQQQKLSSATQVYAALNSGNTDIAKDIIQRQLDAAKNSGNAKDAAGAEAMLKTIDMSPGAAKTTAALMLSAVMGPDKFESTFATLQKSPIEAQKLSLEAANLPNKYALENQNAFQDIETKKLNRDISVLDAQIKGADSETKRGQLQLERDKLAQELGQKQQDKQVEAQTHLDTISRTLDVIGRVSASPTASGGFGGVGSVFRPGLAMVPGTNAKDFDNLLDTAKSQQFTAAISQMKGMGALSDAEGKKIEKAVASLDPNQSEPSFRAATNTIKTTLERAQAKIIGQRQLPKTEGTSGGGSTYVMTHPKYGVITDAVINSLLATKPGMTREQAVQFFKESGGK